MRRKQRSRLIRVLLGLTVLSAALSGCAQVETVAAGEKPAASSSSPKSKCTPISDSLVSQVNDFVAAKDPAYSVSDGVARLDEESGLWLVAGGFTVPEGTGDSFIGVWATDADITADPFVGDIWAVAGNAAEQHSTAPVTQKVLIDETRIPVVGCYTQMK